METYEFIADEKELRWFFDYIVPPLKQDEVWFCSLSARNKKLTEAQREYYKLGRSEMFQKTIIRKDDWQHFYEAISGLECNINGHLTRAGLPYPKQCLVVYWNINPTSVMKCIADQQRLVFDLQEELCNAALKQSKDAIDSAYHKLRKVFDSTISLYARNTGTKYWLDFDFDVDISHCKYEEFIERFRHDLTGKLGLGNFAMVQCAGGLHVLVRKSILKFNPAEILEMGQAELGHLEIQAHEAIRNDNEMTALPGCWQYGIHPTWIINKQDFSEDQRTHR